MIVSTSPEFGAIPNNHFSTNDILSHFESEGFHFFLEAFDELMRNDPEKLLRINRVFGERNKSIFTTVQHFSWLIPRCYIFLLVQNNPSIMPSLVKISKQEWMTIISDIHNYHYDELEFLLLNRIVATFVPNRYAALGGVLSLLQNQHGVNPRKYVDLGCSANLGIGTIFQNSYVPEIVDRAGIWKADFRLVPPTSIVGIDIQQPNLLWTACSSWQMFISEAHALLQERQRLISNSSFPVNFILSNITDSERILSEIELECVDIVHASLVQYFLSQGSRRAVSVIVEKLLAEGGYMIETDMFEHGENFNTPGSVKTRIRVKRKGRLSGPITLIHHSKHESSKRGPSDSCRVWRPDTDGLFQLKLSNFPESAD